MKKIIGVIILVIVLFSCKKNKLGGDCVIEGIVHHHEKIIPYASVFIKFNAIDLPSTDTNAFDAKVRADKDGYFKFNVYKGKYFIYGFAHDYAIAPPYEIRGGLPIKVRSKEKVSLTFYISDGD